MSFERRHSRKNAAARTSSRSRRAMHERLCAGTPRVAGAFRTSAFARVDSFSRCFDIRASLTDAAVLVPIRSMEAARLHQKTNHEHKERLALGTPLTDQYMHAYWPPESPWSRDANAQFEHMVGYFRCCRPGCEQVEFRTRRELSRYAGDGCSSLIVTRLGF